MGKRRTQTEFIEQIKKTWDITENDFELLSNYQGWDSPITFKCKRCGQIKNVKAYSLLKKNDHKQNICRCYGYSSQWHQELEEFNNWKENQTSFNILEPFQGNTINILVSCKKCGARQKRSISSLIRGDGCQVCELKSGLKKTATQFDKELYDLYGGEYLRVGEYDGAEKNILIKHVTCGKIYKTKPHYILSQKGGLCPICKIASKGEKKILTFLEKHDIKYLCQYRLSELKKCPYDFYLPEYNLLIEYQGIQHFQPVSRFGGKPSFIRQQEIDKLKKNIAEQDNYQLLIIPYTRYNEISEILAQRLSRGEEQRKAKRQPSHRDEDIV